ncbi:hypothetical protein D3C74_231130 [compost metagenome]
MNENKKREIVMFLIRELKEYYCYCGRKGVDISKIYFNGDYWTNVDIKCKDKTCDYTRTVKLYYPDELMD